MTYVERPFEGTKSPAYRALFDSEPRNVAVYLGNASGGLCAIDFDAGDDLAAFLALNAQAQGYPAKPRFTRRHGVAAYRRRVSRKLCCRRLRLECLRHQHAFRER